MDVNGHKANFTSMMELMFLLFLKLVLILEMIARVDSVERKTTNDVYQQIYPTLFEGLGYIKGKYEIKTGETVEPFKLCNNTLFR